MFIQEWSGVNRDRYKIYWSFKTLFEKEKYISSFDKYCFRVAVAQARFGVLPFNNNLHRYSVSATDRNCAFCMSKIENEYHFLFECPIFVDLRNKFMQDSTVKSVRSALEARILCLCQNVSKFVLHAINRRKNLDNE